MTEFEGQIWVAQHNDDINFICTTKRVKKKIQAINEKGRDLRLSEDKLLWHHPNQAKNIEDWHEQVINIQATVEELFLDIDVALLWESALELELSDIKDFADLYFGAVLTTEHLAAIWQVVSQNRVYFKRHRKNWEPRSIEQVQELKAQHDREVARIKAQTLAHDWLLQIARIPFSLSDYDFKIIPLKEEIIPFVERLEAWLRGDADKIAETLIIHTAESVKLLPRELVFEILQKIGRLPLDADRDIIIAGLKPEFSASINQIAQAIPPYYNNETQSVVTDLLFSIDDEDTREVDDALSIERENEEWKITIAIADPACIIHRGDSLDREAMRRGTTVYLPTQTVLMLPQYIACDIASLTAEHIRSSIVIRVWLDDQGNITNNKISREAIRVRHRLNYNESDQFIAKGDDELGTRLRELLQCAKLLHQERIVGGAFVLQRPEYKISVHKGDINVMMINHDSPSRLLVAEMMILANHVAAKYAYTHEVPLIYRLQPPPIVPITPEMTADPLSFHKVRKLISRSSLSLQAGGHSGLGLTMYTQFSSPLRRFADLAMQRQLMAHLLGETLPYNIDELFKVLETAERTAREARSIEREAKKRWLMQYLKQTWGNKTLEARVINEVKGGYKVEMQPWGVEGYLGIGSGKTFEFGDTITVVLDKIRVRAGTARLKLG
ncbi:MAG: RNB domain-containing ribonuclease [Thiomargarita sp.]|nr:RNB domain-containing ribonuclease [Thiomargarita sp.]